MKHSNLDVPTILVSQIEIDKLVVYGVVDNKKGYIINVFLHWCYDGVCTLLLVPKKLDMHLIIWSHTRYTYLFLVSLILLIIDMICTATGISKGTDSIIMSWKIGEFHFWHFWQPQNAKILTISVCPCFAAQ